jgi:hypothetical protein
MKMRDFEKYFDAPMFESVKSKYTLRYQNEFEQKLMKHFDEDPKIKEYFQPLMSIKVKHRTHHYSINIDFCIQYMKEGVCLVHIEKLNEFPTEDRMEIFNSAKNLLDQKNFGFIAIKDADKTRVPNENIKFDLSQFAVNFCFANFKWIN